MRTSLLRSLVIAPCPRDAVSQGSDRTGWFPGVSAPPLSAAAHRGRPPRRTRWNQNTLTPGPDPSHHDHRRRLGHPRHRPHGRQPRPRRVRRHPHHVGLVTRGTNHRRRRPRHRHRLGHRRQGHPPRRPTRHLRGPDDATLAGSGETRTASNAGAAAAAARANVITVTTNADGLAESPSRSMTPGRCQERERSPRPRRSPPRRRRSLSSARTPTRSATTTTARGQEPWAHSARTAPMRCCMRPCNCPSVPVSDRESRRKHFHDRSPR